MARWMVHMIFLFKQVRHEKHPALLSIILVRVNSMLIGILRMVYYNPYITWVVFHPLFYPKQIMFFFIANRWFSGSSCWIFQGFQWDGGWSRHLDGKGEVQSSYCVVFLKNPSVKNEQIILENPNIPLEHTPGIYKPPNERNSFINRWLEVWGMFQGYVGKFLEIKLRRPPFSLFNKPIGSMGREYLLYQTISPWNVAIFSPFM